MNLETLLNKTVESCKVAIVRQNWTAAKVSEAVGITSVSLNTKLNSPREFRPTELICLCNILRVPFPRRLPSNMKAFKYHMDEPRTEG